MPTLSYTTAGESHGPGLLAWIDGLPQGLELDLEFIDNELLETARWLRSRRSSERSRPTELRSSPGSEEDMPPGSPLVVRGRQQGRPAWTILRRLHRFIVLVPVMPILPEV